MIILWFINELTNVAPCGVSPRVLQLPAPDGETAPGSDMMNPAAATVRNGAKAASVVNAGPSAAPISGNIAVSKPAPASRNWRARSSTGRVAPSVAMTEAMAIPTPTWTSEIVWRTSLRHSIGAPQAARLNQLPWVRKPATSNNPVYGAVPPKLLSIRWTG